MNYKLAKELKDAGFPYPPERLHFDGTVETPPTLSELIEACGECFVVLKAVHDMNQWIASDALYDSGKLGLIGIGSSPESAVANLWLVLNRKGSPESAVANLWLVLNRKGV